jgi:hypothetical protein
MFVLIIEQPNYNRVKFYFDCTEVAAAFINHCMSHDDGRTSYTLEYKPGTEEKESETDGN